jgi:tetratricopeptide (TPR) repeat protein
VKRAVCIVVALALLAAGLFWAIRPREEGPQTARATDPLSQPARTPTQERRLREAVARSAESAEPEVQERVGRARLSLAHAEAARGDFGSARRTFLEADRQYKGTGAQSAEWGGVTDQAAYQAAVCLVAEGRREEAEAEFLRFLRERPLSPLVHAAHRRLARLKGSTTAEQDALLQAAVARQEERIRFETSVCGPKTIEHLFPNLGKGYKEIAALCGTNDGGTTLEGMRRGLKALGLESHAYKLNRRDLEKAPLPAILLQDDHYVALKEIREGKARIYDPRYRAEQALALPPLDDPDFFANLILFSDPELQP